MSETTTDKEAVDWSELEEMDKECSDAQRDENESKLGAKRGITLLKEHGCRNLWDIPEYPCLFQDMSTRKTEWEKANIIPLKTRTLLAGHPGLGKSMLALQIACSLATGVPFLGCYEPIEEGKTIYVCAEDDPFYVHLKRLTGFPSYKDKMEQILSNIFFVNLDRSLFEEKDRVLIKTKAFLEIQKACEAIEPKLMIIDPIGKAFGVEENDNALINKIFMNHIAELHSVKDQKIPLLEVHHLRKHSSHSNQKTDLNSVRGAGAYAGDAKCVLGLMEEEPDKKDAPSKLFMKVLKNSYSASKKTIELDRERLEFREKAFTNEESQEGDQKPGSKYQRTPAHNQ